MTIMIMMIIILIFTIIIIFITTASLVGKITDSFAKLLIINSSD